MKRGAMSWTRRAVLPYWSHSIAPTAQQRGDGPERSGADYDRSEITFKNIVRKGI
jgi:hypothetical protein